MTKPDIYHEAYYEHPGEKCYYSLYRVRIHVLRMKKKKLDEKDILDALDPTLKRKNKKPLEKIEEEIEKLVKQRESLPLKSPRRYIIRKKLKSLYEQRRRIK